MGKLTTSLVKSAVHVRLKSCSYTHASSMSLPPVVHICCSPEPGQDQCLQYLHHVQSICYTANGVQGDLEHCDSAKLNLLRILNETDLCRDTDNALN